MTPKRKQLAASSLVLAAVLCAAPGRARADLTCEMLPSLLRSYVQNHVRYRMVTDEIEQRLVDSYVRRADAARSLLLADEAAALRGNLVGVLDRIGKSDCSPLKQVHRVMMEKRQEEESYVRTFVSADGYELDPSVELVIDPDERDHPASVEERDARRRSLIHFQMSNYLAAGTPLDEAKQRLIHRYELRTRRLAELSDDDLYAEFIDAFATSLDPHSSYLPAESLEDFRISMSLSLEGIGVALSERDGYAVAERIIPGGAADRQKGLKEQDKIIAVAEGDGEAVDIIDMPLRDAVSLIRGKKGTPVRLTVLRQGEQTERLSITIVRDKIDLDERAAKLRFEQREVGERKLKLAVLDLPSFYGDATPGERQATDDVRKLLGEVREAKVDGLLLDLARNGGGLLEHAVEIAGYFLRQGSIVGIQNALGRNQVLSDRDGEVLYSGPLVVHTSRISASASEIVAGALKDYRRAVLTGDDHTFGKGTVQTVSSLPPGQGALKITTALYFRPGGLSTQNDGVATDLQIPSLLLGEDFGESSQRYSLPGRRIGAFLGDAANSNTAGERWRPVDDALIRELATRSAQRVAAKPEFEEIRARVEKARSRNGVVRLADIIEEREIARANGDDPDAEIEFDDGELTPQVEEALSVLADLVLLTS
jgi:carboxyl-terminal processing protease